MKASSSDQICSFANLCAGCSEWEIPYAQQLQNKKTHLAEILAELSLKIPDIEVLSLAPFGLRDRFDLTIEEGRIGLYSKQIQFIVDLPTCQQLSPALNAFYQEFRQIPWSIKKGSVRLRVSPTGKKGAWLDFSHLDIKKLLDEKNSLQKLLKICHVEIGQRKKVLVEKDRLRLEDPILLPWSRTWQNEQPIPLYGTVATFSQAGDRFNQLIIQELGKLVAQAGHIQNILEYGAGNGNLTFSLVNKNRNMMIIETDELALQGLRKTAEELQLSPQLQILSEAQMTEKKLKKLDCVIANPPRAGLKNFLERLSLILNPAPLNFIYMSCYPESFLQDAKKLIAMNYELKQLKIIDQFPQTKHYEIISRWRRA